MNKHILLVMKWLNDKDSVTQEELKENRREAYAAYAAYDAAAAYAAYAAAEWVSRYFKRTGENKQDYTDELNKDKGTMFTKENTARATHAANNGDHPEMPVTFYDCSTAATNFFDVYTLTWVESVLAKDEVKRVAGIIELSRPQSDIDELFEGAPDWATGYAKLTDNSEGSKNWRYWIGDKFYAFICSGKLTKLEFCVFDEAGENFEAGEFTIIATRPPVEPVIAAVQGEGVLTHTIEAKPVFTKAMSDAGEQAKPGSRVNIVFIGDKSFEEVEIVFISDTYIIAKAGGDEHSYHRSNYSVKPIDIRTDKERLFDDIYAAMEFQLTRRTKAQAVLNELINGKLHSTKYTGK